MFSFSIVEQVLFALVLVGSVGLSAYGAYIKYQLVHIGQPDPRDPKPDELPLRLWKTVYYVFAWAFQGVRPFVGVMHTLVFVGFFAFLLATTNHVLKLYANNVDFTLLMFSPLLNNGYALIADGFALLVFTGIVSLAYRRYVMKPRELYPPKEDQNVLVNEDSRKNTWLESLVTILFISLLMVSFITTEGLALALTHNPVHFDMWRPLSSVFGMLAANFGPTANGILYHLSWWVHIMCVLGFAVYIPFSKHLHLVAGPINLFYKRQAAYGKVDKKIDLVAMLESEDEDADQGMGGIQYLQDLSWKNILDTFACIECGRCDDVCPANQTGKSLSPKWLIVNTKHLLSDEKEQLLKTGKSETPLVGHAISDDALWSCTTCGGCMEVCPMAIEHIPAILGMRQHQMLEAEEFPHEFNSMFANLERQGNPWGQAQANRDEWARPLNIKRASDLENLGEVDVLYWAGCAASYEEGGRKVATAFAKLLQAANVSFAILGKEEKCCGDAARRCGNEFLAQVMAAENVETLNEYQAKKIVTACPHCLHTLKNEFPSFGGHYEVYHHTEYISSLVMQGQLKVNTGTAELLTTFHDPCYLGRHNKIYDAPRELVELTGSELVEMDQSRQRSFCCGAGGGQMWKEENVGTRVNVERTRQALETKAAVIAVGCPFCMTMMNDGVKDHGKEGQVKVKDVAELILEKIETPVVPSA